MRMEMQGLVVVALIVWSGCSKTARTPGTACERFAHVKLRCDTVPSRVNDRSQYLLEAEQACLEIMSVDETHPNAFTRDEIRCTEASLECGDFYDCRGREWQQTMQIRWGLEAIATLRAPGETSSEALEPSFSCATLRLAITELKGTSRPLGLKVVQEGTPLCERDAWVGAARRDLVEFERLLADAEARRAKDKRTPPPNTFACASAQTNLEQVAVSHRDEQAVKALAAQIEARCSKSALGAMWKRWAE